MGMWNWLLALGHLVLLVILVDFADCVQAVKTNKCEFFNDTKGVGRGRYPRTETCDINPTQRTHCFILWHVNKEKAARVVMKGCWVGRDDCNNQTKCEPRPATPNQDPRDPGNMYFCCCEGDYCNRNISVNAFPEVPPTTTTVSTVTPLTRGGDPTFQVVLYTIVPMLALCILIPAIYLVRTRKMAAAMLNSHMPLPTNEPPPPCKMALQGTIVLDRHRARGRFGEVHSAFYHQGDGSVVKVAVKIFQLQERKSWILEQTFFHQFNHLKHENVLRYYGAEEHHTPDLHQLWLVTDFHERGSLYDYLKGNLVSWNELLSLCTGMARGLEFLHDAEYCGPAIAHRDFKSKNVLIKEDMTACIADFGLSLRFDQMTGQVHGQVGTRRYMAPEVLDGAINFNCHDFLCIDMYAMGLVMWEVMSRCSTLNGLVGEYQLPFEEEAGLHPTLEEMQELVVRGKTRPTFKQHWSNNQSLAAGLCSTIEECWDQDAEARLSASTVVQRLEKFPGQEDKTLVINIPQPPNTGGPPAPNPPSNIPTDWDAIPATLSMNMETESTTPEKPLLDVTEGNTSQSWHQPLTASLA